MKRSIFLILLFLIFATALFAQDKQFSFGLYFTPRYDYYSKNIELHRSFVNGNFDRSNFSYVAGVNFTFYGEKINKHFGIGYSRYKFNVNYNYNTPICPYDSFVITKCNYITYKTIFNAGISKQVYNSNILSIMPSLCLTIPLFLFFPNTNKEFFLNGDDTPHPWGDADFFNLINKMFNYPMINLNTQFVFYPQSTVGFILSPFIETSINFWDNPRYSYSFAAGISCVLSFNFPSNKNK